MLARFIDDIVLLYENGIGDLDRVVDILQDDGKFLATMVSLAQQPKCGTTVLTQLSNGIEMLERRGEHEVALQLSQEILKSSTQRDDPILVGLANQIGNDGIIRNHLVKSKWDFTATDHLGTTIDQKRFEDNVSLIVFFSSEQQQSERILHAVSSLSKALAGRPVQYVFVEVAEKTTSNHRLANSKNVKSPILLTNLEQPNNYLKQCPTRRFPYLVLIDKNGIVDSINISLSAVLTRIEYLLSKNPD